MLSTYIDAFDVFRCSRLFTENVQRQLFVTGTVAQLSSSIIMIHGDEKLNYYKMPLDETLQAEYKGIFKTDGFNWSKGYICGAHWSSDLRKTYQIYPFLSNNMSYWR